MEFLLQNFCILLILLIVKGFSTWGFMHLMVGGCVLALYEAALPGCFIIPWFYWELLKSGKKMPMTNKNGQRPQFLHEPALVAFEIRMSSPPVRTWIQGCGGLQCSKKYFNLWGYILHEVTETSPVDKDSLNGVDNWQHERFASLNTCFYVAPRIENYNRQNRHF